MCSNPDYDLEAYERSLDDFVTKEFETPTIDEAVKLLPVFNDLLQKQSLEHLELHRLLAKHKLSKYRKNSFLIQSLCLLVESQLLTFAQEEHLRNLLKIKRGKSHSGILSITVFTSPYPSYVDGNGVMREQRFTCNWNCHYCPNEPGQPRSYLKGEPGVLRANRYGFDACKQMWGRLLSLYSIGHKTRGAKLEVLILGGTFTSYPVPYREQFIRDLYYAANTFHDKIKRPRLELREEININKDAECRIIGLTVEFRPDCITRQELLRLRSYGCTRVQLGVQHIDDDILKAINRQCTTERYKKSLKLLKDVGYKVDIHIMANLPFSSPERDRVMMIDRLLGLKQPITCERRGDVEWEEYKISEPDLSADQWKLYPCETVPYTEIEKWYREGSYVPYPKEDLYRLLYDTKKAMYPWIRCNRIIRDIPKGYIIASSDDPNTGQILLDDLRAKGDICMCIRCREVKEKEWDGKYTLRVRHYHASDGDEYFASAESEDALTLYGFLRLRLRSTHGAEVADAIFPELEGCALIRELHVYGNMNPVGNHGDGTNTQHKGIGKALLTLAESIANDKGYKALAVIAGIGVQRYYEKYGYHNDSEGQGDYMIKYV
jgi:histone acetyltransferase (RNA polymerase elongator complex component)